MSYQRWRMPAVSWSSVSSTSTSASELSTKRRQQPQEGSAKPGLSLARALGAGKCEPDGVWEDSEHLQSARSAALSRRLVR